jgi:UDP-GlcNAc:undecaprenyl-phosphate/decaprenyl-phosphate GlcNAc-1-phosphate transferase
MTMGSMALIAMMTLAAAVTLTVAVRTLARRWGIVDRPDGRRKLHRGPVPLWGGVAVYGATVLGLLAARLCPSIAGTEFVQLSNAWMIAAGIVCFVGGIDDRFDLPSRVKLLLQIGAVLPLVLGGHYVDRLVAFSHPIELGWLGMPLTVLWLVGCINALNLIDGMDGLASIVGLSTAAMLGVIAASQGHTHVAAIATVLAASLLGFLTYNLPPASVFLGDSGSMVIGLSVGLLGIQGSLKTSATLAITAPAVVMTLPMFDIIAALVRRRLTGRRFDSPDRLHIHHRLLDRGWTPWQILCLTGAICLTCGGAATAATIFRRDALAWITAMSLVVLMIRLRLFGYEEFALAKGVARHAVRSCIGLLARAASGIGIKGLKRGVSAAVESRGAQDVNDASWDLLLRSLRAWDVHQVEFCSLQNKEFRRIRWIDPALPAGQRCRWSLSAALPIPAGGSCELCASRTKAMTNRREVAALTSLLETFGAHFAEHLDQIFGPATADTKPVVVRPTEKRKAA